MTPTTARRNRRPIYVESRIHAPVDDLWDATQLPDSHQRWDVRFGSISYLPQVDGEAQRFTYATTVAPGVTVAGTGESLGERDRADGTRWSGLKFWAADRRSIIEAGAGYWRYVPTDDGVRFLTRYDYRPRWGRFGELVDRVLFRPVFGWATAWSFDRLRLWLEEGTPLYARRDEQPDDDAQADMYLWAVDRLARAGYAQYEISNFARDGFRALLIMLRDRLGLSPVLKKTVKGGHTVTPNETNARYDTSQTS